MTGPSGNPWQAPQGDGASQHPPPYGQQHPAPAYGAPPPGWQPDPWAVPYGPVGRVRPTGKSILLFFVTLGIYTYVYNYKVHKEMKEHSGRGVGGGVALLLTFVANVAMPFVTSAEVGSLYSRRRLPEPVRGWTGLWFLLPMIGGYLAFFLGAVALAASSESTATGEPSGDAFVGFAVALLLFAVVTVTGAIVWFVKTNGALNRYWRTVAQR
jgi:hypothetical protein